MKTITDIKNKVQNIGGTVEEDEGYRDMRVLQIIAPARMVWNANECQARPLQWAKGKTPSAAKHNAEGCRDVAELLELGVRPMTEDEKEEYGYEDDE